jgi:hypothetical protein
MLVPAIMPHTRQPIRQGSLHVNPGQQQAPCNASAAACHLSVQSGRWGNLHVHKWLWCHRCYERGVMYLAGRAVLSCLVSWHASCHAPCTHATQMRPVPCTQGMSCNADVVSLCQAPCTRRQVRTTCHADGCGQAGSGMLQTPIDTLPLGSSGGRPARLAVHSR